LKKSGELALVVGCCMDQGVKSRISVFLFMCKECLLSRKNSSRKPYGFFDVCVFGSVQKVVVGTICVFFCFRSVFLYYVVVIHQVRNYNLSLSSRDWVFIV